VKKRKKSNRVSVNGKREKPGGNRAIQKKKDSLSTMEYHTRPGSCQFFTGGGASLCRARLLRGPLHNPVASGCSCGNPDCGSAGKHPRVKNWQTNCSRDSEVIQGCGRNGRKRISAWWQADRGWFVLDVDKKNGGFSSLNKLMDENAPLPETLENLYWRRWASVCFQAPKRKGPQ